MLAAKFQPNDHAAIYKLGCVEYELGNDAAAVKCFQRILTDNPTFGRSYFYMGNIALKQRDFVGALQHYAQALKYSPDQPEKIHGSMGHCYFQQQDYTAAKKCFDAAVRADRQNPRNYIYRAWCHFRMNNFSAALKNYNAALQLDSEDNLLYQERGLTHLKLRQYRQAAGDFAISLLLDPKNAKTQELAATAQKSLPRRPTGRTASAADLGLA